MLAYYSEFPGPSLEHCKKTIQSKFYKTKVDDKYKSFLAKIKHGGETQAKLINSAFECADVFTEGVNKYSFSGWLVFGIPDVMYFLKINIEKYYDKMKLQMTGLFKSLVYLKLIYQDTLEKLYCPESLHVKNVIKTHYKESCEKLSN